VDRLITELKLPPADAYHKLRHTIEEVNALITTYSGGNEELLVRCPHRCVLSFLHIIRLWRILQLESCWLLHCVPCHGSECYRIWVHCCQLRTKDAQLQSFSKLYCEVYGVHMNAAEFARRLWGDVYYHSDTRTFRKKAPERGGERSFVQFILDPLYKIYAQVRPPLYSSVILSLMACLGLF
jgi:U5 small nuclear ribonucleoprotein component